MLWSTEWLGTPFHLTLCVQSRKTNPAQKQEKTGSREELTATEELMHSDSRETFVAWQQYWLGWPVSTKRLCCYEFQKWTEKKKKKKKESNVTDTTLEETDFWNEGKSTHGSHSSPSVSLFPSSSLTRSGRLASCQTHFYFNPYTS